VQFADAITFYDPVLHQTPHSLGSTSPFRPNDGDPFFRLDSYHANDKHWKDLPSRFIQQVWRYDNIHSNKAFLDYVWPSCKQTYEYLKTRDIDGDGLPNHLGDGVPDNSYDGWGSGFTNASTICSGLWIGALEAMKQFAIRKNDPILSDVEAWLARARASMETSLWFEAGGYYRADSGGPVAQSYGIMADALNGDRCGQAHGLPPVADTNRMRLMLEQVYDRCVVPLPDVTGDGVGDDGALTGLFENGELFPGSYQHPNETWAGATYSIAASMFHLGLKNEALQSAWGIYERCYENTTTGPYWFNTPE